MVSSQVLTAPRRDAQRCGEKLADDFLVRPALRRRHRLCIQIESSLAVSVTQKLLCHLDVLLVLYQPGRNGAAKGMPPHWPLDSRLCDRHPHMPTKEGVRAERFLSAHSRTGEDPIIRAGVGSFPAPGEQCFEHKRCEWQLTSGCIGLDLADDGVHDSSPHV